MTYVSTLEELDLIFIVSFPRTLGIAVAHMVNVPMVEKIGLILILSLCQCREHKTDNYFYFYDPFSHIAGDRSTNLTVSTKSQGKQLLFIIWRLFKP